MKKHWSIIISSCMLAALAGAVGAQQNRFSVVDSPENAPATEGGAGAEAKQFTNMRIASLAKSGVSDSTIVSLILQFPCECDASPEALSSLRAAGVSPAVINAVKLRAPVPPSEKPRQNDSLPDNSSIPIAADAQRYAFGAEQYPVPDKWAFGLVYPGVALRCQASENTAWEIKAQSGSGVFIAGPRFYYYIVSGSGLSLFCGAEGDYIRFKGEVSKGSGFAGGAFLGGDIPFAGPLSLSMDFGPMYMTLKDNEFSQSVSGVDYIINMGVYWHFK